MPTEDPLILSEVKVIKSTDRINGKNQTPCHNVEVNRCSLKDDFCLAIIYSDSIKRGQ
jgi:hypothetical protein